MCFDDAPHGHAEVIFKDVKVPVDNILLGAEPDWRLTKARAQVRHELEALMRDTGLQVRLALPVEELPVGERQRLEILKTLYRGAHILILDEPTAVLTPAETEALFHTLRGLRERGTTILLITHKLKEIMALCDNVTVMRAGAVVLDTAIADTSLDPAIAAEQTVELLKQLGVGYQPTEMSFSVCDPASGVEYNGNVSIYASPGPRTPIGNDHYVFPSAVVMDMITVLSKPARNRVWIKGWSGTGSRTQAGMARHGVLQHVADRSEEHNV